MKTTIHQALIDIQGELKAPKTNYNKFGNYAYRSAEDILEALKPLLKKNNCTLILNDDIVLIGDRFYIKATATLSNEEGSITACGVAREDESKKGMDGAQITGSCSSYARKYALNGLFAIDDTKDPDTKNNGQATKQVAKPQQQAQSKSNSTIPTDVETCIKIAQDTRQLMDVWTKYPQYHNNDDFRTLISNKKKEFGL